MYTLDIFHRSIMEYLEELEYLFLNNTWMLYHKQAITHDFCGLTEEQKQ